MEVGYIFGDSLRKIQVWGWKKQNLLKNNFTAEMWTGQNIRIHRGHRSDLIYHFIKDWIG